jgi:hypothetical protein
VGRGCFKGREAPRSGRREGIEARAWKILVSEDFKNGACCPGHHPGAIDRRASPTVWDRVEGPIYFILGGVVNSLISVEERVKTSGRLSAGAVGDDGREILRLARGEAPKDTKDRGVIDGPAKDDELWFSFVALQVAALVDRKLDRRIKRHPPFISIRNRACGADLAAALALAGKGGRGLFQEVKFERAPR